MPGDVRRREVVEAIIRQCKIVPPEDAAETIDVCLGVLSAGGWSESDCYQIRLEVMVRIFELDRPPKDDGCLVKCRRRGHTL